MYAISPSILQFFGSKLLGIAFTLVTLDSAAIGVVLFIIVVQVQLHPTMVITKLYVLHCTIQSRPIDPFS